MHRWDRFSSVHFFARLGPVLNGALLCKVASVYFQQKMEKISKNKERGKDDKKENNYHSSNMYKFNIWYQSGSVN